MLYLSKALLLVPCFVTNSAGRERATHFIDSRPLVPAAHMHAGCVQLRVSMLAHTACQELGFTCHGLCREVDAARLLDGANLDDANNEDTSGPLSATLELQVWPKPVFRMPRSAFADLIGLPARSRACDAGDDSEGEVSMAGPRLAHD